MSQNNGILEGMFKISERGSTIRQEVIGGVTTFLAMSYGSWNGIKRIFYLYSCIR